MPATLEPKTVLPKVGDFVYIHNTKKKPYGVAHFGIVEKVDDSIHILEGIGFHIDQSLGQEPIVPTLRDDVVFFPIADLMSRINSGETKLYIGKENIKIGLEENRNPNYSLVEFLIDNYIKS